MTMLLPLFYLVLGLFAGRLPYDIKGPASALLTRWVIPAVIIWNIATHRPGVFDIMAGMMLMMGLMLLLHRRVDRDPVASLCFCYLNIGWLGLPVVSALFGDGAAMLFIAAYVGSSLFGNAVGAGLMAGDGQWRSRVWQTLKAPPVWALLAGIACMPFGAQFAAWGLLPYAVLKWLMGFLGMGILGIWLSGTRLSRPDFRQAAFRFVWRSLVMVVLISLFVLHARWRDIKLVTDNVPALYLLCLLPPAANIIVLETHYRKTGRSAGMIACGTCLSIVAIALYVAGMAWWRGGL